MQNGSRKLILGFDNAIKKMDYPSYNDDLNPVRLIDFIETA